MSEENIENVSKSGSNFSSAFVDHHALPDISFNGYSLINNNISILIKTINLYISYILSPWLRNLNTHFTLNHYLFEFVELTKNANPDKYKYSVSEFSFTNVSMRKNVIILQLTWAHLWILIIKIKIS